jgi:hypothetical protein
MVVAKKSKFTRFGGAENKMKLNVANLIRKS